MNPTNPVVLVLDTNVISALVVAPSEAAVVAWLNRQVRSAIWTTAISVFEVRFGLACMPRGKRRARIADNFEIMLARSLDGRVLALDHDAVSRAADVAAARRARGRIIDNRGTMIAGIVLAHRATLATRNTRHFDDLGLTIVDPWTA